MKVGQTVKPAYLSQEVAELDPVLRVLEAVEQVAKQVDLGGKPIGASSLCDRFGFTGNAQWTRVGDLSGGERRRLQLLRLLMGEPNVLLLDEPTNDLDIDTLNALEDVLDGWPGTLLVVSHDRYFLERTTDGHVVADGRRVDQGAAGRRRRVPREAGPSTPLRLGGNRCRARSRRATAGRRARSCRSSSGSWSTSTSGSRELHAAMAAQASDHAAVIAAERGAARVRAQKETVEWPGWSSPTSSEPAPPHDQRNPHTCPGARGCVLRFR